MRGHAIDSSTFPSTNPHLNVGFMYMKVAPKINIFASALIKKRIIPKMV
jgi:hypothetical protein